MLTRGDFHIHSTASDGSLTPGEIVRYAMNSGIDTIAIADHNSTDGINEAAAVGRYYGVSVIPAVELSTRYRGESIHLLGYFRNNDFYHYTFQEVLKFVRAHKFREARLVLNNFIYTDNNINHLSVTEGINFLRTFGAAVVLAHPVRISRNNLTDLLCMPFDGLEAKYCHNTYYDTCFFINKALTDFSFYSGGSDFHTDRCYHRTHCTIGNPHLNQMEIQMFLKNSGAAVLS
jgi:3',5'-nucleoside bisphosphate phosphatase